MTLKVTTEPRENRQLAVAIEVPQERVEQELRKAANKVSTQYRLPGFRKGKAPYHIVVQQFGLANLYNEFVDKLGDEMYKAALEQEQIQPYATASLEDIQFEPLTYKLVVPLEPVVALGDYRALRVEPDAHPVDEAQVEQRLEALRDEHASWRSVDRPSAYGDMLTIDVKSVIAPAVEGDAPIVVLDETDWDVTPDAENPMDPPGFDEALLGINAGETREFTLAWPAESQSIYAGKQAAFSVSLKQIQAYDKPPLDDDFAKLVDSELDTLDALRAKLRTELEAGQSDTAESEFVAKALDAMAAQAALDYPPAVIEDQLDSMMRDYDQRLRMMGIDGMERFFAQTGQDPNEFRESLREQGTAQARRNLVLSEIISKEQITVAHEEIDARIEQMTQVPEDADDEIRAQYANMGAMLNTPTGHSLVLNDLLREKAIARLLAIVRGEELPDLSAPPAAEESAAAAETPVEEPAAQQPAAEETATE